MKTEQSLPGRLKESLPPLHCPLSQQFVFFSKAVQAHCNSLEVKRSQKKLHCSGEHRNDRPASITPRYTWDWDKMLNSFLFSQTTSDPTVPRYKNLTYFKICLFLAASHWKRNKSDPLYHLGSFIWPIPKQRAAETKHWLHPKRCLQKKLELLEHFFPS